MNENVFSALEEISKLEEMEFQTLAMFNSGSVGVFWSEAGGPRALGNAPRLRRIPDGP
jgi:hypothetical protein